MLFWWLATFSRAVLAISEDSWRNNSTTKVYAVRSQRDIMANITIDQIPLLGVDLREVLFNEELDDKTEILEVFNILLNTGVQSLILDIEMGTNAWIVSNTNVELYDVLQVIKKFLDSTNTNLSANLLFLMLRVNDSSKNVENLENYNDANNIPYKTFDITEELNLTTGLSYLYTPADLSSDRIKGETWDSNGLNQLDGWPTLSRFLYDVRKRLIITELTETLDTSSMPYIFNNSILHFDEGNSTLGCPTTFQDIVDTSLKSWRFLDAEFTSDDLPEYINCGYSAIISNRYTMKDISSLYALIDRNLLWSWGYGEPENYKTKNKDKLEAFNCAAFIYTAHNFSASWKVNNCYDDLPGLCASNDNMFAFLVTDDGADYFDYDNFYRINCPDNYVFAIPHNPLQQRALIQHLKNASAPNVNIWIDLNSIAVKNCWVTGGPYATCPYEKEMSRRNFTRMITPALVCSFGLLVIVTLLNLLNLPIHNNRSNWKRIVNKVSKSEIDGVPS